jgi:hypothetical protein
MQSNSEVGVTLNKPVKNHLPAAFWAAEKISSSMFKGETGYTYLRASATIK